MLLRLITCGLRLPFLNALEQAGTVNPYYSGAAAAYSKKTRIFHHNLSSQVKIWVPKQERYIKIRRKKYPNSIVERDHRAVKRRPRPMMSFKVSLCPQLARRHRTDAHDHQRANERRRDGNTRRAVLFTHGERNPIHRHFAYLVFRNATEPQRDHDEIERFGPRQPARRHTVRGGRGASKRLAREATGKPHDRVKRSVRCV